ncbi:MAG: redoxin domain-containing protein [Sediminibacterium sp.]|nr:redoxin domain-containing protein [Sediminibacterium sp.]
MSLLNKTAPAFKLVNTDKKEVSLTDYTGKNVILLFFPLAFTSVCTAELCGVRDNIALYNNANAVVFGISVDSPFTLGQFKADQGLNFELLSDFNKEVSTAYGSIYQDFVLGMKGVSKRSAFVIDANGIVRYEEVLENAGEQPNFDKIKEVLANLG